MRLLAISSFILNFLRNFLMVFHDCTNLCSHKHRIRLFFSLHPQQYLLFIVLITAFLVSISQYLTVVLTCLSLTISEIKYFFSSIWWPFVSSFEKFLFRSFAHFKIRLFAFLLLSCLCSLCVLEIKFSADIYFAKVFCSSVGRLFSALWSPECTNAF